MSRIHRIEAFLATAQALAQTLKDEEELFRVEIEDLQKKLKEKAGARWAIECAMQHLLRDQPEQQLDPLAVVPTCLFT